MSNMKEMNEDPMGMFYKDSFQDHGNSVVLLALFVMSTICILAVQVGMILWRKRYPHSFQTVTLCALFCVPPITATLLGSWWFILWWSVFCVFSGFAYFKAREKPLQPSTPRSVIYILGFFIGLVQHSYWMMNLGSLLWCYGVYFGLLVRDLAMYITDTISVRPGFSSPKQFFPNRVADPNRCSLCGHTLHIETQCRLSCDHIYHESCIRGWCMLGKKSTCPQCREKVDYQLSERNPWETPDSVLQFYHECLHWAVIYFPILLSILGFLNLVLLRLV